MGLIIKLPLAIFILLVIQDGSNAARILGLCIMPSRSHFAMCGGLLRGLAARGHQVDVVSPFPMKNPPPNYNDISIGEAFATSVNNVTLEQAKRFTTVNINQMVQMGGTLLCNSLNMPQVKRIIENPPKDPPYDLIITELFATECFLAFGRHLKVPIVGVVTSKLYDWMNQPMGNPPSTAIVPSSFSRFSQRMTFLERLQNTVQSGFLKVMYWHIVPEQKQYLVKHFGLDLSSIEELYEDIALILVNTHPSFDFVRPMTPAIVEVGGLHVTDGDKDLSPEVKKWLDESKNGCVYFSFGSMVKIESFPIETIKVFYEAFERIAPVRVLIKIAKNDELPAGLPKNVMTSQWLPQTRVLQHKNVKAFVTHCGLMSVQESITYGVPMIGVPLFSDQYLNMRLCEGHKIMVPVDYDNMTADSFTKALNTILKDSTYSENSKRLAKLFVDRPMSAMDTATYWVEYVIRNGNVLRSPATKLTWWQMELLDVYGFLIAVILLALYIVKKFLGLIFKVLCSKSVKQQNNTSTKSTSISKKNK